ncbi:MAG: DUF6671 family protein, partial [Cyanobacteriota bacterium]
MPSSSPYSGARVALATRHGKERVIGRALRHGLGAELLHVTTVDTDALGTFCGGVARQGTALEACVTKAKAALAHCDTALAIASEGSFGPHPHLPFLAAGLECMVFLDRGRCLMISEQELARRTNFAHRLVSPSSVSGDDPDFRRWLGMVGFPSHALIVRPNSDTPDSGGVVKGLDRWDTLELAIAAAAAASIDGLALVETDMRAHRNPTRMTSIRRLAFRLVRRVGRTCPACQTPGWGVVEQRQGLRCGACGLPTALVRTVVW